MAAVAAFALFSATAYAAVSEFGNGEKDARGKYAAENAIALRIGANGMTDVRGAKVTGITGTTLSAVSTVGSTALSWTVQTDAATKFRARNGEIRFADIRIGDTLNFKGMIVGGGSVLSVQASSVTDVTVQRPNPETAVFQGRLKAIAGAVAPTTLTLAVGNADYAVKIAADTVVLSNAWARTTLARFAVGDTVRVYGTRTGTSIDAVVVRNVSIWLP